MFLRNMCYFVMLFVVAKIGCDALIALVITNC